MLKLYGAEWDVEEEQRVAVELKCYRYPEEVVAMGGTPEEPLNHFRRACRLLFREHLVWNSWVEARAYAWCYEPFTTHWGCASVGKSNDFGAFALVDFYAAPTETYIPVCSTTKKMLEKRIWASVKHYHALNLGRVPAKLSKTRTAIIQTDDDDKDDVKCGIHGFAVRQGSEEAAEADIVGVHTKFIALIIDEMQDTRRAAIEARFNLSKGCQVMKVIGLGNPNSTLDLLGEYSTPVDGFDSISVESFKWKTKYGHTYHYDGFKCPAVVEEDGAEKYPFYINQKQIDDDIEINGADHPKVWVYCRGFPPPSGITPTVLNETMISKFRMMEPTEWAFGYQIFAGLDPAFTAGGDHCILQPIHVGLDVTDRMVIEFQDYIKIPIDATHELPPIYQIAHSVKRHGESLGFRAQDLTVDETGTQSTGDVIDEVWARGCHKISFGGKPTTISIAKDSPKRADEEYYNRVTELWYQMHEFGRRYQIRGLGLNAAQQFCRRRIVELMPKKRVESKIDMKAWLGHSPDEADACACAISHVREVCGLIAGSKKPLRQKRDRPKPNLRNRNEFGEGGYTATAFDDVGSSGYAEEAV